MWGHVGTCGDMFLVVCGCRERRKDKMRTGGSGKNLAHHEGRLVHQKRTTESRKHHTPGRTSAKDRSRTPPQLQLLSEETKSSKKKHKMQRMRDHDEKFLHPNPMDISRSLSEDVSSSAIGLNGMNDVDTTEPDAASLLRRRGSNLSEDALSNGVSVTESLNLHHLQRRDSGALSAGLKVPSRGRVRRTNSDAQFFSSDAVQRERRCPHERKQFYRQFTKNLKLYGIRSAANRMEASGSHGVLKYHSHSVISSSGVLVNPKVEKIWLEIRSKLKSCNPHKDYAQWLFFKQPDIDAVLRKVVHFCFTGLGAEDAPLQRTRVDEAFHSSLSSPVLHSKSKAGQKQSGDMKERGKLPASKLLCVRRQSSLDESCIEEAINFAASSATEPAEAEPSNQLTSSVASILGASPDETSTCKVHHREYLSLLQRKALSSVTELLDELGEAESYYMNRRNMGDKHHIYCTLHFKRRVCALILWQKVTFGLAEILCRLSNWLGTEILLPDVCKDPPPQPLSSPLVDPFTSAGSVASVGPGLVTSSGSSFRHVPAEGRGGANEDLSASPLKVQAQFSIGPVEEGEEEEEEEEEEDERASTEEYPSGSLHSYGGTTILNTSLSSSHSDVTVQPRTIVHQASVLEPYRDFVSRSLKRTGLSKTTKVSTPV